MYMNKCKEIFLIKRSFYFSAGQFVQLAKPMVHKTMFQVLVNLARYFYLFNSIIFMDFILLNILNKVTVKFNCRQCNYIQLLYNNFTKRYEIFFA